MTAHLPKLRHPRLRRRGPARSCGGPPPGSTPMIGRCHGPAGSPTVKSPIGPRPMTTAASPACRRARSDAMEWHGERLHKAGMLESEAGGQAVEQRRRHGDQLGEAAVAREPDAGGQRHRAAVRRAGPAVIAHATGNLGVDDRQFPCGPARDAVADCVDDPGDLVTGDRVGEQPHLVRGQIRSADAAAVDPDHPPRQGWPPAPGYRRPRGGGPRAA